MSYKSIGPLDWSSCVWIGDTEGEEQAFQSHNWYNRNYILKYKEKNKSSYASKLQIRKEHRLLSNPIWGYPGNRYIFIDQTTNRVIFACDYTNDTNLIDYINLLYNAK